ncbi:MAG: hypothetical protein R2698_11585 [Microthrixaceae bacterium]
MGVGRQLLLGGAEIAAMSLLLGGLGKLRHPDAAARSMAVLWPRPGVPPARADGAGGATARRLVRAGSVVEIALAAVSFTGWWRAATVGVGLAFTVFALVVEVERRRGVLDCGCFGAVSARPTGAHVALNVGLAAVSGTAAVAGDRHRMTDGPRWVRSLRSRR